MSRSRNECAVQYLETYFQIGLLTFFSASVHIRSRISQSCNKLSSKQCLVFKSCFIVENMSFKELGFHSIQHYTDAQMPGATKKASVSGKT